MVKNKLTKKICIDARHVHGKMQGLDRFILEVINHLPEYPHPEIYILHNNDFPHHYIKFPERFKFIFSKTRGCNLWQHLTIPFLLRKYYFDVYFYPYIDPPLFPPAKKNIFMIHDLNHYFFSRSAATTNPRAILAAKIFINLSAFTYNKILTISKYVAEDIKRNIPQSGPKLIVQYEGFSPEKFSSINSHSINQGDYKKYILYVGNNRPHKNLECLLNAFSIIKKSHDSVNLVIAGNISKRFVDIYSIAKDLNLLERIFFKESVTDTELAQLYKNAYVFVYPSLSEGFGLPLLEAMYFEIPIAASKGSCIPEIAEEAVLYFNPYDYKSIANALDQLLINNDLRKLLIQKGREQVKKFTWSKTAEQLMAILFSLK